MNHMLAKQLRRLAENPPEAAKLAAELVEIARALEVQDLSGDCVSKRGPDFDMEPYAFLANTVKDAMTLVSRDYVYVVTNQAFRNLIPPNLGNPIGLRVAQVWGEQNFERSIRPALDRCLAGELVSYELWLHPPDENEAIIMSVVLPIETKAAR